MAEYVSIAWTVLENPQEWEDYMHQTLVDAYTQDGYSAIESHRMAAEVTADSGRPSSYPCLALVTKDVSSTERRPHLLCCYLTPRHAALLLPDIASLSNRNAVSAEVQEHMQEDQLIEEAMAEAEGLFPPEETLPAVRPSEKEVREERMEVAVDDMLAMMLSTVLELGAIGAVSLERYTGTLRKVKELLATGDFSGVTSLEDVCRRIWEQ